MGKTYDEIGDDLKAWIGKQKMFFVSTAPNDANGHVNCSPKGHDSFRVLDGTTVAYRDFTGSGIETIAHLKENGRIVILFCALEGPPKIVRLHGRGESIERDHPEFESLSNAFGPANELGGGRHSRIYQDYRQPGVGLVWLQRAAIQLRL